MIASRDRANGPDLLKVEELVKSFGGTGRTPQLQAVAGLSFSLAPGETLGLVGESGCGKSTTGRCIIGLERPSSGKVLFEGEDVAATSPQELRQMRRKMQYVFQDPYASLNPLISIEATISEPLLLSGMGRRETKNRVAELLTLVGLSAEHASRFPHEFSGGQRQRIGIARALALEPRLLILDEPVSALDVSIQAQIVNLLEDLQARLGLAYLFIAHDLSVISHICDRVAVMYLGKIVEIGSRQEIFENPKHPYTKALLSAVPIEEPTQRGQSERILLNSDLPNPARPPSGCRFRTRCYIAQPDCAKREPSLDGAAPGNHLAACFYTEPANRSQIKDEAV